MPKQSKLPKLKKLPAQSKSYKTQTTGYKKYYGGKALARRGRYGPMGEIPDSTVFVILPKVDFLILIKDKNMEEIFRREMRLWYGRVVDYISRMIVGDPRVGFYDKKGLVPKGGTGRMRLATRTYLVSQYRRNTNFPFKLNFAIPVMYAKPTFHPDKQLKHYNERANRITAYTGGRIITRQVNLDDPEAENDVNIIINKCIEHSGSEFKRLLNRYSNQFGFFNSDADDFFVLEPSEFRRIVVS